MTGNEQTLCLETAGRIAEALDGALPSADRQAMEAHLAVCRRCERLYERARQGRDWLAAVDEIEPPPSLVHNILAATSYAARTEEAALARPRPTPWSEAWSGVVSFFRQPRLVMTAAMAFFSLSMLANVTGATIDDLQDLRPSTVSRRLSLRYHETAAGVTRYYVNNRFLRELQDGLQALRDVVTEPVEQGPEESQIHG